MKHLFIKDNLTNECWPLQIKGKCFPNCVWKDTKACTGKRMLATGKNGLGLRVPLKN